jgi:hypothetical protein
MVKESIHHEQVMQEDTISDAMKQVDFLRNVIREELDNEEKSAFGQFFTPYPIAELMDLCLRTKLPRSVSLMQAQGSGPSLRLLSLLCARKIPPHNTL